MAKKMTHEEFLNRLNSVNPNVIPISNYNGKEEKISAKCKVCEFIWEVRSGSLLRGYGCPKCAGNAAKSTDEFVKELRSKNSNITVLDEYKGANTRISVACNKCGIEWQATPSKLLNGHGCPQCAKEITTNKRIERFIKKEAHLLIILVKF